MNFTIKLLGIKSISKIENVWNSTDYISLLELFDFGDASSLKEEELFEMLSIAVSDFEPEDAAEIVLTYKLANRLKSGQIKNLAQEMLQDKVAEEYPDISFHYDLFNINQLLHNCYNGKFPKIKASVIDFELIFKGKVEVTKEIIVRTISDLLSHKSLLKRLFSEQLDASVEINDAESIIWRLETIQPNTYRIISSDYWLNSEDFEKDEHKGELGEDEIHHPK
jgi:hypothetical protein